MAAIDYAELAKKAVNNHSRFESFGWHDAPDDRERWTLVYTSNRDSGLVDRSNAACIDKIMKPFVRRGTARREHHGHWLVGHVDGYAIRVYTKSGKVTAAFRAWCDIQAQLESYPILDDEDHSRREYEESLEWIKNEGSHLVQEGAPEDWPGQVFTWLWDNNNRAVEPCDDGGACPEKKDIRAALAALGLLSIVEMNPEEQIAAVCAKTGMPLEGLLEAVAWYLDGICTDTPEEMQRKLSAKADWSSSAKAEQVYPWHSRAATASAEQAARAIERYLRAAYRGRDTLAEGDSKLGS